MLRPLPRAPRWFPPRARRQRGALRLGVGEIVLGVALCLLNSVSGSLHGAEAPGSSRVRVDPAVREALRSAGRAVCFVNCRGLQATARGEEHNESAVVPTDEDSTGAVLRELVGEPGALLCHQFRWIPSLLYELTDPACLDALERLDCVESVVLDERGGGFLEESLPATGFTAAHDLGLRGRGTVVAILDTGVDRSHPALRDSVIREQHFLMQTVESGPGARDDHGHGTHVAGIVASRGIDAPLGVAPEAELVVVKVLDARNRGWISDWIAGVEYVIELDREDNGIDIDAINMSFGTDTLYRGSCDTAVAPFYAACRRAAEQGITVVAASGNASSLDGLPVPACYTSVIPVGSVTGTGLARVSSFTNRGFRLDLLAPGDPIVSTGLHGGTSTFRGTSQAAPHAAGLVCLLREASSLEPAEVRDILLQTGREVFDLLSQRTYRVIDAARAVAVAQVPRATELACFELSGGIQATWHGTLGVDHYRFVVERADETLVEEELAGGESSFRLALETPGVLRVSLQPFDRAGRGGLTLACEADLRLLEPRFVRGECDQQGGMNVTDPLFLVNYLFTGGSRPGCLDSCNANGDPLLNVADVIYSLNHLFLGGAAPLAPFGSCGVAQPADGLGCDSGYCA